MKLFSSLILFLVFLTGTAFTQTDSVLKEFRINQNNAFTYGERLSFEVSYGFLTAAEAFMTISPAPFVYNGRETYEINFDVNSRSSFDMIYKVRDNYKTYIDSKGTFPWRFEQHIRENDYKRDFEATFIQESLKVYTKVNYAEDKNYKVPYYVQDLISAFYYARTMDFKNNKEGDVITVPTFYKDKVMNLNVRFEGREIVDVAAGKFKTIILKPELKEGFTSKTSDIYIWLTDDDRKVPVQVKMKIVIGSLVAELTQYSGLNGPLDAKLD
jgi:hypothetical protein